MKPATSEKIGLGLSPVPIPPDLAETSNVYVMFSNVHPELSVQHREKRDSPFGAKLIDFTSDCFMICFEKQLVGT
jgi:hypothetical protein